jgi:flagellin-specific chaperone FliS
MKEFTQHDQDQLLSYLAAVRQRLQQAENHLRNRNITQANVYVGRADEAMYDLRNQLSVLVTGKPLMLADTTEEG